MFKGLFEKKNCDICDGKIGVLGNRKLDDGNLCKDCAKKLSPFFSERRKSTVEDIRKQLQYREENEKELSNFVPTRIFGKRRRVLIDERSRRFLVTHQQDWQKGNPDIIGLDQVTYVNLDVDEDRDEVFREGSDGKKESYSPPRYEYEYAFWIDIGVQSPWFDNIRFQLNDENPRSRHDSMYRNYEREANELRQTLLKREAPADAEPAAQAFAATPPPQPQQPVGPKFCGSCGGTLDPMAPSKFCPNCGAPTGV